MKNPRHITVSENIWQAALAWCRQRDKPMSHLIQDLLEAHLRKEAKEAAKLQPEPKPE